MSVMASASGQQIDIAASVRAAYQFARDNARLAVNLALVPFAIVVGAEFLAWLVGGGGWFGMSLALLIQAGGFAVFVPCSSCAGTVSCCLARRQPKACSHRAGGRSS
jgi:predicted methyltransferase